MFSSINSIKDRKTFKNTANLYFKNLDLFKDDSDKKVYMNNMYKYKGFLKKTESYYIKITNVKNDNILNVLREYCDFIPLSSEFLPPNVVTFWVVSENEANALTLLSKRLCQNGTVIQIDSTPRKYRMWDNLTSEYIKAINEVCSSRYSPENNTLDLTSFLHEEAFNVDGGPGVTLEKVDVVLIIAKFILSECPNVEKISFSSNHLHSLECLEPILHVAKKLHTIDISFNFIKNVSCFRILKRFKLKEIYAKQFQSDKFFYLEDKCASSHISSILRTEIDEDDNDDNNHNKVIHNPILNFDDFPDFSTHFQYEEHFLATDPVRVSFFNNIPSLEKAIKTFVQSYIIVFDDDDFEKRRNLKGFYRRKVKFSLCISPIQDGRRCQYHYGKQQIKNDQNSGFLSMTHNMQKPGYYKDKINEVLFIGNEETIDALLSIPPSKHDMSTLVYDVTYSDVNVVIFTVKGLVNFGKSRLSHPSKWVNDDVKLIVRSFVCSIQKNSLIKIVSELVTVYPSTDAGFSWYKKSLLMLEPSNSDVRMYGKKESEEQKNGEFLIDKLAAMSIEEKHRNQLLEKLCHVTKMVPKYSLRCLIDCNYDYAKALETFEAMKHSIPAEAFDPNFKLPPF